ncbi:MAG: hypothetical protein FGM27_08995 [Candidatus Omnitrophica bacterium]|nr:hypothetical protein [Candidatus Omnitrophota bacterium]
MFKSFPDQEILKKVFEEYFDRGELTGSTAAAIFNDNAASYQGIEDWRLYQEGLRYFLETMEVQGPVLKKLDAASESLEEEKEKTYSEKLLEIDRVLMLFQKNEADLISVLSKLSSVRTPDKGSGLALLCEQSLRMTDHDLSVDLEVRKLADQIKQFFQMNPRASGVIAFNQQFQEFQISRISPESFALFLREEAKRQSIHVNISQRLTALISTHKRIRDIEGTQLWNELSAYSQSVKEALFRNEQERSLDKRSHRLDILNRLLKLELNREDWEEIKQNAAGMQWEHFDPLLQSMQPHLNFYENAEEREHAFGRQIDKLLKKSDSKSAVVILGGFHSKGIAQKMRLEGVSYALITPKIEHLPEAPLYREQMRGKVSWAKYFEIHEGRINLYNAFIRGTRDLLLQRAKDGRGTCLKLWRDKIIRDLAEQGRIAESIQYTRFLDEAARKHEADYAVQWESNIRQFIAGLRQFKTEGRLTEQNIANLLKVQSIPAGPTAAPVARNELRADLLLGVSHKVQPSDTPSEVSRSELRREVPIQDLVAYLTHPSNADLSALKQAIDADAGVQSVLDQAPGNRQFHRDLIADFVHSIFSEEHRPLIEIVANAIDASTASGSVPRDIDVHLSSEGFEVIDTGTGMNLETVLTKLLIPMISGQEGIAGKHGRFGVGFFSVLNYLKTPQDRLIVQTSQGQGGGYTISFRTDGKQIYAALTPQRDLPQGTRVHLKTESFDTSKAAAILEDTFHAKAGVSIRLDQAVINHPEFYETILDAKGEGSIRVSQKKVTGKAKVIASVAGAKFFDMEIEGVDIPEEIVVDFPLSTPFPVSRNTFEVNQSLRNTIKMYIQKLSVREDALERLSQIAPLIEQINRKNPLRNKEGEDLVRILTDAAKKVPRQKDELLLPADPAFQGVTIAGKRLRFTDRSFINEEDQEKWEPYLLPGFQSSISVYKVHFAGPAADKKVLRSLDAGYAFINEDYFSGTALNLAHWDLLLNKEGVLGAFASPEPEGAEKKQGESSTRGETKVIETEPAEDFSRLEGIPSPKSAEEAYRLITEHPFYGQPLLMHTETSEFTLDAEVFNKASRAFGFEWLFHLIYSFEEELVKRHDWGVVADTHFVRMMNSILSEMVTHYETHGRDEIILLHEKGLKAILSYHKKYPDITLTEWARVFFYDILVDPNYWSMVSAFAYLETFPEDIRRANHKTDYAAVMPAEKRSVSRGKFDLKNGPTKSLWHVVEKVRHEVLGVPNYEGKVEALRNVARLRNLYITALERVPAETLNSFDVDSYFTSPGSLSGQFETMLAVFSGLEEFLYIKSLFTNVYTNKNHMREVPPEERILWEERFHYLVTRVFDGLDTEERRQLVRDFVDYAGWEGSGNASARIRPYLYFLKYGELVDIRDKPNLFESSRSQVPARQAQASIAALIADALQGGAEAVDADALWRKIQSLSGFRPSPSALQYAQRNLLHSVHFYTGEPRVYVRELIQNVLDEIKQRKLRSVGRKQLEISIFRDQRSKMLAVNFKDKLGVRFLDLIQTLLIPGASSKRLKEELLGRFGHGFFSIFQNAKAVTIRTSTGNGSSYLIQLEPYWNIENDRVEDIDFIVQEIKVKTEPGTEIELLLDIPKDDQEFEAAMIAYAVGAPPICPTVLK